MRRCSADGERRGTSWRVVTIGTVRLLDEVEHVFAVLAAPDPGRVLERDHVHAAGAQVLGDRAVVVALIAADPVADLGRVLLRPVGRVEGDDLARAARRSRGRR